MTQDLPNGCDVILGEFKPGTIQYKTHIVMKMVYEKKGLTSVWTLVIVLGKIRHSV